MGNTIICSDWKKSISLTEKYEEEIGSSRVDTNLKSEMWVDVIWKRRNKITEEHLYGVINPVLLVFFRQHFIFAYIWCYNLREKQTKKCQIKKTLELLKFYVDKLIQKFNTKIVFLVKRERNTYVIMNIYCNDAK